MGGMLNMIYAAGEGYTAWKGQRKRKERSAAASRPSPPGRPALCRSSRPEVGPQLDTTQPTVLLKLLVLAALHDLRGALIVPSLVLWQLVIVEVYLPNFRPVPAFPGPQAQSSRICCHFELPTVRHCCYSTYTTSTLTVQRGLH